MKCCDYTAGMLSEPVTFQRVTLASDGAGGQTRTWATLQAARANVRMTGGSESFGADRTEATARFRIVCRYFAGLTEADAVLIRNRRYQIRMINNVEFANKWYEIDAEVGVAV